MSYRPDLSALLVDPARVAALTDAVDRLALVDLLEVRALVGAVFGDGVRVVGSGPAGPWPPAGSWLPAQSRRLNPYGTATPTTACPCCGATAWYRAGTGLTCGVCHPPPNTGHAAITDAALDATLFGLAERAGFPRLALGPALTVLAGEDAGRRFAAPTLVRGLRALVEQIDSGERPISGAEGPAGVLATAAAAVLDADVADQRRPTGERHPPAVDREVMMNEPTKAEKLGQPDRTALVRPHYWDDAIPPPLRARARAALHAGDAERWLMYAANHHGLSLVANNWLLLRELGCYERAFLHAYEGTRVNNHQWSLRVLDFLFAMADRPRLREAGDPLPGPGPFTIYRGVAGRGAARRVRGYSWTGSREVATWYAQRFAEFLGCPTVLELTIDEPRVVAYVNWRQEDEYLVMVPDRARIRRMPVPERTPG